MNLHANTTQPDGSQISRSPLWLKQHSTEPCEALARFTVHAPDKKTLFCRAAWTLFSRLFDLTAVKACDKTILAVQGADLSSLMSAWLTELTALHLERHLIFKRFSIMEMSTTYLKAEAEGEDSNHGPDQTHGPMPLAEPPVIDYANDEWIAQLAFDKHTPN